MAQSNILGSALKQNLGETKRSYTKEFLASNEHPEFDITRREWADHHILNLTRHNFFGKFTLEFENGVIIRAVKKESFKP